MKAHPEYIYRVATANDVPQLRALTLKAYGQFKDVLGPDHWPQMERGLSDESRYVDLLRISRCYVCEWNGSLVGTVFLIPSGNPIAFFESDWSYIRLLGVDPEHVGKGIGRKLTELCVEYASELGEKTLVLHTSEFQNAARRIYESMGFERWKDLDLIYGKRYWLYKMSLQ